MSRLGRVMMQSTGQIINNSRLKKVSHKGHGFVNVEAQSTDRAMVAHFIECDKHVASCRIGNAGGAL
jgi:hypothetical protein